MSGRLLSVRIRHEHDIVGARRRARQIAEAVGFEVPEQTRIATSVSELARNAFRYAGGGVVDFSIEGAMAPQLFTVRVVDGGPRHPESRWSSRAATSRPPAWVWASSVPDG